MAGKTSFFIPVYSQSTGERAPETIEKVQSIIALESEEFWIFPHQHFWSVQGRGDSQKALNMIFFSFLWCLVVALSPEKEMWLLVAVATHLSGKYCTALKSRGPIA